MFRGISNEVRSQIGEDAGLPLPTLEIRYADSGKRIPMSSLDWVLYFTANAEAHRPVPWHLGGDAPIEEIAVVLESLQAWQLGETSDGSHLMLAAEDYARKLGDPLFLRAVALFIKEEQRHGAMLGKFLDGAGESRIQKNWGDTIFRIVRYSFQNMEVWVTPVIMIETLALVYYRSLMRGTRSRVLKEICRQIIRDEVAHLRFQSERLAYLHRDRAPILRRLTMMLHRILFAVICGAVWCGHSATFEAGGHTFSSYLRTSRRKMRRAWERADPKLYEWEAPFAAEEAAEYRPAAPL